MVSKAPSALRTRISRRAKLPTRFATASAALFAALAMLQPGAARALPNGVQVKEVVEARRLAGVSLSPTGAFAAVRVDSASIADDRETVSYALVALRGTAPPLLIDGGPPLLESAGVPPAEAARWSPDGHFLYFRKRGADGVQIWQADTATGESNPVTNDTADVEDFRIKGDGSIVYRTGATRAEIEAAEKKAAAEGVVLDDKIVIYAPLLRRSGLHDGAWTTIRTEGTRRRPIVDNLPFRYHVVAPGNAGARAISATADVVGLFGAPYRWDASQTEPPAPTSLSGVLDQLDGGWEKYAASRGRPKVNCRSRLCDGDGFMLAGVLGSAELALMRRGDADTVGLVAWSPKRGSMRTIVDDSSYLTGGDRWDRRPCPVRDGRAICIQVKPDLPPRLIAIDLRTSAIEVLYDPNQALAARHHFRARIVEWPDSKGRPYSGILVLPDSLQAPSGRPQRWPLVVTSYRCQGYSSGGIGDDAPQQVLAGAGIASLCVSARPPAVDPPVLARPYKEYVDGVHAGIAKLASEGLIDPGRVGVSGRSFSGEAILYDVSHGGDYAAASSAGATVLDPYYAGENDTSDPNSLASLVLRYHIKYPIDEDDPAWKEISPALNAGSIRTPLLMQPIEDEYGLGLHLYNAIRKAGGKLDVIIFPDEAHLLISPLHKWINAERNVQWFRFWLQGHEDPDPRWREQYARWEKLCDTRRSEPSTAPVHCVASRGH
jgi:dipeptidyl aminopeptidase/acylaminoacyl peptidase